MVRIALTFAGLQQFPREGTLRRQFAKVVEQSFRQTRLQYWLSKPLQTALLHSPERSQQIATIYRRNKTRSERLKRARVVPVQHVSAMLLQALDRRQGLKGPLGEFRHGEVSKFTRHLSGVEKESDICRRYPCRNGSRFFLDVVRYQPVVLGSTVFGKISP